VSEQKESWATREASRYLGNNWYGVAEGIVQNLVEEEDENPFVTLAERLRNWAEEELLSVFCPKEFCHHVFDISGVAEFVLRAWLDDVNWDAIAREYEEDLVREGGNKISDYEWTWEEADGGEWDDN
jgi:hypothetical protein